MSTLPTVIDGFCGAGGLSLGFKMAGFQTLYAFDVDKDSVATYRRNIGHHAYVEDIYGITKSSIEERINCSLNDLDVVVGGPPCQGFSVQRRGEDHDDRNYLVLEYVRLVLELKPRFFLMENVGGILAPRGKPFMEEMKRQVGKAGYGLHIRKLNAYGYGVPQIRKRVFVIGERTQDVFLRFEFPEPCRDALDRPETVEEAIRDLMGKTEEEIPNHKGDSLSSVNLERIRSLKAGQGRDSLPEHLQLDCHRKNKTHRHLDVYGRMAWNLPSPTITARFDSFSRGRFGHPELDRTITLREGARLQSFPDDFIFVGTKVQIARQIGNAVPPLLAKALAESIKKVL